MPDPKKYEKFLPKRLAQKYLESVNDPEIIAFNDDIALVETRTKQLINNIDKDEPPPVWDEVNKVFVEFLKYDRLGDTIKRGEALLLLTLMFDREKSEREAWDEIFERLGQVAKFRTEERKRRMDMKSLLDAEKAMDLVSNLLAAVHEAAEEVLEDEQLINQLYLATAQRFVRITGSGDRDVLEAVGSGKQQVARSSGLD